MIEKNLVLFAVTFVVAMLGVILITEGVAIKREQIRNSILESRVAELEERVREHSEVMVTYKFFNEHWTSWMNGETGR